MTEKLEPVFVFWHYPKSGGTTLTNHLKLHFDQKKLKTAFLNTYQQNLAKENKEIYWLDKSLEEKNKTFFIAGHAANKDAVESLSQLRKPVFFTILRDTASRLVSLYNYYYGKISPNEERLAIASFVDEKCKLNSRLSAQFLYLFMQWDKDRITKFLKSKDENAVLEVLMRYFEIFDFIGDHSTYDKDVNILCNMFNAPMPKSNYHVAGQDIPKFITVTDEVTEIANEQFSLDIKLHELLLDYRKDLNNRFLNSII